MTAELWEAYGAIALACMAFGALITMLAINARHDRRAFDAEIEAHERRIEKNRAERKYTPRHDAKSQPRASDMPPSPGAVPDMPRTSLVGGPVRLPRSGAVGIAVSRGQDGSWYTAVTGRPARRVVTTAADIPPVFLPEPGTRIPARPQPAGRKRGCEETGLFRRVDLSVADTGELRALTTAEFRAALDAP